MKTYLYICRWMYVLMCVCIYLWFACIILCWCVYQNNYAHTLLYTHIHTSADSYEHTHTHTITHIHTITHTQSCNNTHTHKQYQILVSLAWTEYLLLNPFTSSHTKFRVPNGTWVPGQVNKIPNILGTCFYFSNVTIATYWKPN